ncbi:MAG TPA: TetR/AcrR family transcriptional regulator [Dehalococcoidia bacterium]|nr:TetR/AcrR family transcriptional regulator [Dehalococcoidia bacterium]
MPKVLPEYLELRRQQILDAAAACFSRRGFHQTTMQDICGEAELSPGAVYRYFRSKEEIIEGMGEHRQQENAARLAQVMSKGSTVEVFDELLRVFFIDRDAQEFLDYCSLTIEFISEATHNERVQASLRKTNKAVRDSLIDLVRQSQARGDIDATLDPEGIARVMIALYQGFLTQKLIDPDLDVHPYARAAGALFAGTFWRGDHVTSPAAAPGALQH